MKKALSDVGEFGLISMIDDLLSKEGPSAGSLEVGIGDDSACFIPKQGFQILITCDSMVEGRHFLSNLFTPIELGRRAMTINISDIGAMGGLPVYAVISLGLKNSMAVEDIMEIYRGFLRELHPFRASIVGGNIASSPDAFFIDITLIGEVKEGRLVRRSTAKIGDVVFVTGYPGEAAAGLNLLINSSPPGSIKNSRLVRAYKNPAHRAFEGKALADSGYLSSMIDISDGFLGDLGHICDESHVGAEIFREELPLSDSMRREAESSGVDPYDFVLGESDDYELIITCAPENAHLVRSVFNAFENTHLSEVGRIVESSLGIRIINPDSTIERIKPSGWDHFK